MFDAAAIKCLCAAAGLLIVGLFGWRRGRRRVGDTPHCRRCDYILSHSEGRCPECGTEISARTVVHGERRRHAAWLTAAVLLFVGAVLGVILPATGVVGHVDWFHLRPAGLLLKDLDSSDPRVARRSWAELERRARAWSLSRSRDAQLIDLCLGEMTAPTKRPTRDAAVIFLGDRAARHALSADQEAKFFDALVGVKLTVRPRVGPGDDIPCATHIDPHGPATQPPGSPEWFYRLAATELTVDGKPAGEPTQWHMANVWNYYTGTTAHLTAPPQPAGRHELAVTIPLEVCYGHRDEDPGVPARVTLTRRVTATVDVLPETPPVAPADRPGLTDQLRAALRIKSVEPVEGSPLSYWVNYNVRGTAVAFAAHVVVVVDGKEYPAGMISSDGSGVDGALIAAEVIGHPAKVNVIVRGDAAAARKTLDLYANWFGEIVFRDMPVKGATTAPATQP